MSERMTAVFLRGSGDSGIADWGLKTPAEMIAEYRRHAACARAFAEAIEAAADEDFLVETYLGTFARRDLKVLQQGRPSPPPTDNPRPSESTQRSAPE